MSASGEITRQEWQQKAAALLQRYIALLGEHGITVGPDLHLQEDPVTPYHYCDVNTGQISLNMPGTESLTDIIRLVTLGQTFGLQSLTAIIDLHETLLYYNLGHELGHYLRHRYGTMTENRWEEEEAAVIVGIGLAGAYREVVDRLPWFMQLAERARPALPIYQSATLTRLEPATPGLRQAIWAGQDPEEALCRLGSAAEAEAFARERELIVQEFHARYVSAPEAYARQQTAWSVHWLLRPDRPGLTEALETFVLGPGRRSPSGSTRSAIGGRSHGGRTGDEPAHGSPAGAGRACHGGETHAAEGTCSRGA